MCFSATASFVASGVLSAIGLATLHVNKKASYLMLALTPLLFAIQQTAEGIVWLTIASPQSPLCQTATYLFLTFAGIIWPLWGPIAVLEAEINPGRRTILKGLTGVGALVSGYMLWTFLSGPVTAQVTSSSITYNFVPAPNLNVFLGVGLYTIAAVIPCFVSSLKYGWLLGSSWLVALAVTLIFKYQATTSVWCFFAAVLSVLIFVVVKRNQF